MHDKQVSGIVHDANSISTRKLPEAPLTRTVWRLATLFIKRRRLITVFLTFRRLFYVALFKVGLPAVTRAQLVAGKCGPSLLFDSEDEITVQRSIIAGKPPKGIERAPQRVRFSRPFVAELNDARLVGSSAVALDAANRIVMESVAPDYEDGSPGFLALPISALGIRLTKTEEVVIERPLCSLVSSFCRIYGHWLIEGLPRIEGYEIYCERTGNKPLLLIDRNPPPWKVQSLALLGYGADAWTEWKHRSARVRQLIIPSFRRQSMWPEPRSCAWLRERLFSNLPEANTSTSSFASRVLVSRPKASGRCIANEDELMEALAPLGSERYVTEHMSIADEVRLFYNAEIVMGAHGSGLMNAVLSRKRPLLIELHDRWWNMSFFKLGAAMGWRHACVQCEKVQTSATPRDENDLIADVPAILSVISQVH